MDDAKRRRLEEAGFKEGTVQELLHLTDEEMQTIEIMLRVERKLWKALRKALTERDEARDLVAQVRALVSNTDAVVSHSEDGEPVEEWLMRHISWD